MHSDGFRKHVAILSACQVLYLEKDKIDKLTYNGSQLYRDMVISLANNNPDIKFYILGTCLAARTTNKAIEGTNELTKGRKVKPTPPANLKKNTQLLKSIFKYYDEDDAKSNIVFCTENYFRFHADDVCVKEQVEAKLTALRAYLEKEGIDYGIMKGGFFNGHIPYLVPKYHEPYNPDGSINYTGKCATMENNTIYSVYVANMMKFPYITINDDDNFCGLRNGRKTNLNIIHPEVANLNMYNGDQYYELYKSYDPEDLAKKKMVEYEVPVILKKGMDTILLKSDTMADIDRTKINIEDKKVMFVYMNFREKNNIRYNRFVSFILENELACEKLIYCNIHEFKKPDYKKGKFDQYLSYMIPNKGHKETIEQLTRSKYTFCCSVFDRQYCIGRFWEAVYCKTIPFVHRVADEDGDLYTGIGSKEWVDMYNIPEYLFVETPEELQAKIAELENDHDKYLEVLGQVEALYKDEYSDKNEINKMIMETVKEYIGE